MIENTAHEAVNPTCGRANPVFGVRTLTFVAPTRFIFSTRWHKKKGGGVREEQHT